MSGETPEPEFVEARPMSKRALSFLAVIAAVLVALGALTTDPSEEKIPNLCVAVAVTAFILWALSRMRVRADADGITSRGPFGTHVIAWIQVDDFYVVKPSRVHVRGPKRPIVWERGWQGDDELMRFVERHATRAPCRSFEPQGVRDCDLPRDFREPRSFRFGAAYAALGGLALSLLLGRTAVSMLMEIDGSDGTAVTAATIALAVLVLLFSLLVLILGVIQFVRVGRTPRMHVHATVHGMDVELDGERSRIRWDEVFELRRRPATRGWVPDIVLRTASKTLALPDHARSDLFELASRRVPDAATMEANEDPVLG